MRVAVRDITGENVGDIPEPCRRCAYWEDPGVSERDEAELIKREWFKETLETFGTCGKILYVDGRAVGYAQYGPSERSPNIKNYGSGPVGSVEEGGRPPHLPLHPR